MPSMAFDGGLVATGLYVLALQLAMSALVMSAIDDLQDTDSGPEHRWWARSSTQVPGAFRLRNALGHFYLSHPLPAGLLAFGLAISSSLIAIGAFDGSPGVGVRDTFGSALDATLVRRSELFLGGVLLLTVLLVLRRRGLGRLGWVVGFATGVVITKEALAFALTLASTTAAWALFSAALLTCLLLSTLADVVLRRRRREQPA